ncbi:MAG: copper-binding protein [Novosphingobium sp.]|nr:MAG: copper-binding protein [Novosphingobium sp.]
MRRAIVLLAVGLVPAASAVAQEPDWSRAEPVTVILSSFYFAPSEIRLRAGRPVTLHLVNQGDGGHNFSAPEFFQAATIRPEDRGYLFRGTVELAGHRDKAITLVPRRGVYKLRCTHTMHGMLGMKGWVVVD